MILSKQQIEEAIGLEQAWSNYLESTKTPEEADLGILVSSDTVDARMDQLQAMEASQQCKGFKEFLRALSDEQFSELQAVMLIGRGDYPPTEFQKACDALGLPLIGKRMFITLWKRWELPIILPMALRSLTLPE